MERRISALKKVPFLSRQTVIDLQMISDKKVVFWVLWRDTEFESLSAFEVHSWLVYSSHSTHLWHWRSGIVRSECTFSFSILKQKWVWYIEKAFLAAKKLKLDPFPRLTSGRSSLKQRPLYLMLELLLRTTTASVGGMAIGKVPRPVAKSPNLFVCH